MSPTFHVTIEWFLDPDNGLSDTRAALAILKRMALSSWEPLAAGHSTTKATEGSLSRRPLCKDATLGPRQKAPLGSSRRELPQVSAPGMLQILRARDASWVPR